jgi:hypothetical protein
MPYIDPKKQEEARKKWLADHKDYMHEYQKQYRRNNKEKCTAAKERYRQVQLERIRNWFDRYSKTMKCSHCPETHVGCLDFHHIDPNTKKASVREMMRGHHSFESLMEEVSKCEVLCSNCHRKLHWQERQSQERQSRERQSRERSR